MSRPPICNTVKKCLAIVAALAVGYAVPALFLIGQTDFGVAMAVAAVCVMGYGCVEYVEVRRDWVRRGRDEVWQRRLREARR